MSYYWALHFFCLAPCSTVKHTTHLYCPPPAYSPLQHYWEKLTQDNPSHILRNSINQTSRIYSFASSVMCIPIGYRHLCIKYWDPLLAITTALCCQPHQANKCQCMVYSFSYYIFNNHGIAWIFLFITRWLSVGIGKKIIYQRFNTETK
jgi:hypothetical protein